MSETLQTDALPKLGNDVFYDIRVLSAKVNSLVITAKDSPEKAEELYLPMLTTVCVYVENYLTSHFSGLNSEYFERFCYSNIYGAEHRFTSLKKLAELSAYTLNSVPQNMCVKNADIASAANRLFNVCRASVKAASAPVKYRNGKKYRVFKPSKRERLLLWELCGGNPEETAEKELSITYIARKNQSAASPKNIYAFRLVRFILRFFIAACKFKRSIHIAYGIFFSYEHYACRFVCGKVAFLSS